jgi:SnoaL-like domain
MRKLVLALFCSVALLACNKPKEEVAAPVAPAEPPQAEIGDAKYAEVGKQGLAALSSGDIDSWMNSFADNAKYYFSGGDSLIGKDAIAAYWKDRRTNVIDKMEFTNDIYTPLKVNRPQKGPDRAGVWLLTWFQASVTYKNGQSLMFWVHNDYHFDANDKIDVVVQYVDTAPIQAALAKKK